MKHYVININRRIVQPDKNFLEPFVQMLGHNRAAIGLADNQAIIHITVIAKLQFQLHLHLSELFELLCNGFRDIDGTNTALRFRLL